MIKYRGLVEKSINNKKVFFKFNMAAFEMLGDLQNMGLSEVIRSAAVGRISTLSAFLYSGAMQYCKQEKTKADFTREDTTDWIEQIGWENVLKLITDCFEAPEVKNEEATAEKIGALNQL